MIARPYRILIATALLTLVLASVADGFQKLERVPYGKKLKTLVKEYLEADHAARMAIVERLDSTIEPLTDRSLKKTTKELLKMGSLRFSELLERAEDDDILAGMKVNTVLSSMPGTGKVKAKRMMESLGIADNRRIRGLGDRQREALLAEFS